MAILAGACAVALFLPQFRVQVSDTGQQAQLYLWGGHQRLQTTVAASVYLLAAFWGLAAGAALGWAAYLLKQGKRPAIAWMNWAALFIALELIFLLVAAEEVLTDLRVKGLHADSLAQIGSWISFVVLIVLLFLPGRAKKALFPAT